MRLEFYEARRQALVQKVRIERQRVMMEEENGLWLNPEDVGDYDPDAFMSGGMSAHNPKTAQSSKSGRSKRNRSMGSNGFSADGAGSPARAGGNSAPKSSMIDKEMAALEKIKAR